MAKNTNKDILKKLKSINNSLTDEKLKEEIVRYKQMIEEIKLKNKKYEEPDYTPISQDKIDEIMKKST